MWNKKRNYSARRRLAVSTVPRSAPAVSRENRAYERHEVGLRRLGASLRRQALPCVAAISIAR